MERGSPASTHREPAAMGHHPHQPQHSGETSSGGVSPASSSASSAVGGGTSGRATASTSGVSTTTGKAAKSVKVCGVCGDRAKSYHFGGISCDSCKAFFRRSVQNDVHRGFNCPYERHCEITINSRKCCQFCRFQKCLDIGMEKSWVMTEEERLQLLKQRMERKGGKQQQQVSGAASTSGVDAPSPSPSGSARGASPAVEAVPVAVTTEGGGSGTESPTCQSLLEESELTATRDLVAKYEVSFRAVPYPSELRATNESRSLIEVITIFTTTIKRLTHFAGQLDAFVALPKGDQAALLRCGMIEMCLIRAAYAYDASRGCWPDTRLPLYADSPYLRVEDLRRLVSPELHAMHMKFNHDVRRMALDEATYMLLMLVVMFSPERPGLVRGDLVSAAQEHYLILLQRYMAWRHSPQTAAKLFPRLLLKLPDLRQLNDAHVQSQLELTASDIREIQRQFGIILHGLATVGDEALAGNSSHSRHDDGNSDGESRSFPIESAHDSESARTSFRRAAVFASEESMRMTRSHPSITSGCPEGTSRHHRHRYQTRPILPTDTQHHSVITVTHAPQQRLPQRQHYDPAVAGPSTSQPVVSGQEHPGDGSDQMHILCPQTGPAWFDTKMVHGSGDESGAHGGNGVLELRRPPLHPSPLAESLNSSPDVTQGEKPP